ncbi:MAG: PQQ-binding-like beta-propeller repeat protein, partial [Planctomycetes bacterium]|nr:PQQ-binding-like beta-propeller repeat protein [Planctomycetota bacterium]
QTLWSKSIEPYLPEDRYGGQFAEHGYASHTPVSDGQRVYVYFGKTGALAFDMEGNALWQTQLGTGSDPRGWGSASSPVLYKNLLIVTASAESEALVALDTGTGKEVWRKEAGGFSGTWGTPLLVDVSANRTDLVLAVPYEIWGFDPSTGKLRWYCSAMNSDSYCSSLVAADGVVYGIEGMGGGSIAVRAGGDGDVEKTHIVWTGRDNNRIGTPIVYEGRIYFFSRGIANCIDAKTGERIYQARLTGGLTASAGEGNGGGFGQRRGFPGGGQDYSSPVIAGGKLYYFSRGGDGYVIKLGPEFEQLAVNRLTADREDFSATPALSEGELFIRSGKHLYCVAE